MNRLLSPNYRSIASQLKRFKLEKTQKSKLSSFKIFNFRFSVPEGFEKFFPKKGNRLSRNNLSKDKSNKNNKEDFNKKNNDNPNDGDGNGPPSRSVMERVLILTGATIIISQFFSSSPTKKM